MHKTEKKQKRAAMKQQFAALEEAIYPLLIAGPTLLEQKMVLDQMMVAAVENAPDDETDNFTARKVSPVYLALSEVLINLYRIPTYRMLSQPDYLD